MIYKYKADNIPEAAHAVVSDLLMENRPSEPVMIKPNIVEPAQPPVTTDVSVVTGIIKALQEAGIKDISVAEGSGSGDTIGNFKELGYEKLGVELIDLDREKTVSVRVAGYSVWKEIFLPEIIFGKFIISVPVLKEHSMCGVTISLKNMVGVLPAARYSGYWTYKKSEIHRHDTDACIADLIKVIRPPWAVVDATVGMKGSHLSGTPIHPPLNLVYGASDPVEADMFGCALLDRTWENIPYLKMIAGV